MKNKYNNVEEYRGALKRSDHSYFDGLNGAEDRQQYMMLKMLAISVFKWEGLPPSINEMYLERILFEQGRILFFEEEDMSVNGEETTFLALRFAPSAQLDVYGIPMGRIAYAQNGWSSSYDSTNSIIVYDNTLKISLESVLQIYARRLADVERIIDVNLLNTKNPYILVTDEKNKVLMEKIMQDIYSNKPLIMVEEQYQANLKKSEVLNTSSPFVVDKLMDYKNTLRNEVLTILGIGNNSQDKRERLLSSEMDSVNMLNSAYSTARLRSRRQAIKDLQKMYPGVFDELTVNFNTDEYVDNEKEEVKEELIEETGVEDNGTIHDRVE